MTNEEAKEVLLCSSIQQFCLFKVVVDGKFYSAKEALGMAIDALSQQRTGHWIRITSGRMREIYQCSECGRQIEEEGIEALLPIRYPFCHCGAKMEEE